MWLLSGVFNPVALWFRKSHLSHTWGVLRTARLVFAPIKLQGWTCLPWPLGAQSPNPPYGQREYSWAIGIFCELGHVSSSARVQKRPWETKFVLKLNTKNNAGIWCPHLKGENQPLCLQQSSPLCEGLQKPPCLRWGFKAASPDWVTMYLPHCCQVVFHAGFQDEQSRLQWNHRLRRERKGCAEMYSAIFLHCILLHYKSNLASQPHKSDCKMFLWRRQPPTTTAGILSIVTHDFVLSLQRSRRFWRPARVSSPNSPKLHCNSIGQLSFHH